MVLLFGSVTVTGFTAIHLFITGAPSIRSFSVDPESKITKCTVSANVLVSVINSLCLLSNKLFYVANSFHASVFVVANMNGFGMVTYL